MRKLLGFVFSCVVLGAVAIVAVSEAPAVLAPAPLTFLVPAFEIERLFPLGSDGVPWVPILAVAGYVLFAVPLMVRGGSRPVLSFLLFAAAGIGSVLFFVNAWDAGVQFQGCRYTTIVAAANALFVCGLLFLMLVILRRPTPVKAWSFHFLLFLWLSWLAFPWLGEMP